MEGLSNLGRYEQHEEVPGHQPESPIEWNEDEVEEVSDPSLEQWVPTEAEKDAAARAGVLNVEAHAKRAHAAKGLKTMKRERDDFEAERPDLGRYFDEFADFGPEIEDPERIKMCRAYASYLASMQAPRPKFTKTQKKKFVTKKKKE